jgi:hypothetical protein
LTVLIIGKREFSREKNGKVLQISVVSSAVDFLKNINNFSILENENRKVSGEKQHNE